jgi:hypothetical protein
LEARTAFRAPEPDVLPEAVAEPGAPQAGVAAAEPDAQREAAAPDAAAGAVGPDAAGAAELDAQREAVAPDAAVVAEPDAQQAVVAVLDAQREAVAPDVAVAAEPDAQQEAAVAEASGARQVAAAASDVQRTVGPVAVARPLVASVEPAETAAVRFWIRATVVSAVALERRVLSAAKVQAAADR